MQEFSGCGDMDYRKAMPVPRICDTPKYVFIELCHTLTQDWRPLGIIRFDHQGVQRDFWFDNILGERYVAFSVTEDPRFHRFLFDFPGTIPDMFAADACHVTPTQLPWCYYSVRTSEFRDATGTPERLAEVGPTLLTVTEQKDAALRYSEWLARVVETGAE